MLYQPSDCASSRKASPIDLWASVAAKTARAARTPPTINQKIRRRGRSSLETSARSLTPANAQRTDDRRYGNSTSSRQSRVPPAGTLAGGGRRSAAAAGVLLGASESASGALVGETGGASGSLVDAGGGVARGWVVGGAHVGVRGR